MKKDRSHLTPTRITDSRGRQTTVYRRPQQGATPASVPAPSLTPAATARGADPLPAPSERTIEEMLAVLDSMAARLPGIEARKLKILQRGRAAIRIAMDLADSGGLIKDDALRILADSHPEYSPPLAADALRVAAHLWERLGPERLPDDWAPTVVQAVRGAIRPARVGWEYTGAKTQTELAMLAATAEFIVRLPRHSPVVSCFSRSGNDESALFITPTTLEDFLRGRPQDFSRIVGYVTELGFDRDDPDAVNKLRAHLDSDIPTGLLGGWL